MEDKKEVEQEIFQFADGVFILFTNFLDILNRKLNFNYDEQDYLRSFIKDLNEKAKKISIMIEEKY